MITGCFQAVTAMYLQHFLRMVVTVLNYETSFLFELQRKMTQSKKKKNYSKIKFRIRRTAFSPQIDAESKACQKYFPVKST